MNEQAKQYQQIIAKCWADESFKQRLMADPAGTLKQEGMEVPKGMTLHVVENTGQVFHLVIPTRPTDLSDEALEALEAAAGGLHDTLSNPPNRTHYIIVTPWPSNYFIPSNDLPTIR